MRKEIGDCSFIHGETKDTVTILSKWDDQQVRDLESEKLEVESLETEEVG